MALTREQLRQREGKLTASRIACIMNGNQQEILNLWREMTGDPDYVPEPRDESWFMMLGTATEQINLDWLQRRVGPITGRGVVFQHPEYEWAAATLDGWIEKLACPVEAKHNNGFEKIEEVIQRYMPQMHWQMICTDAEQCCLSVIRGTKEPEPYYVELNAAYADAMMNRALSFMAHVRNLTPPVVLPNVIEAPKVPATKTAEILSPEWKDAADKWIRFKASVLSFKKAEEAIKAMTPQDVAVAFGHGITVKRSRNGALRIFERTKDDQDED